MTHSLPMGPKLKSALGKYFYFIVIIIIIIIFYYTKYYMVGKRAFSVLQSYCLRM